MKRLRVASLALGVLLLAVEAVRAQSSLDALDQELNDVKQQHQDAAAQNLTTFFSQIDAAMGDSAAAVTLYQEAGGQMPPPTPVTTVHDTESASERDARLAQDAANAAQLGGVLELHCGLMHYAALFVTDPNRKGLQDDFNGWLQKAAQTYPMVISNAPANGGDPNSGGGGRHRRNGGAGAGAPPPPPFRLGELKGKTMKDSVISGYLGFKLWGDKEQGGWAIKDIPRLFRVDILEPLRAVPSQATLAAWDALIAMANADETDSDRWTTTDYPPLQFDRACDEYAIEPSTEKLEGLLQIIHANPTHPQADDWITRAHKLIDDYRAKHRGRPAVADNAAPSPATNSNVTVTTVQQGDATIVTTHTNTPPVAPAPPSPAETSTK